MAACGGSAPANETANSTANSNTNSAHPPMNTVRNEGPTENNAPTLGPVVQQYYKALEKKDDQMVRDTLTAAFAKEIEQDMKETGEKNLAAYIAKSDYQPGLVVEVRNEKINGNKGVAQLRGGAYKNWTGFSFSLENGKWRLDNGSPEVENMPKPSTNSPH
jgi:hypothetical protein